MKKNILDLVNELNEIVGEDVYLFSEKLNIIKIYTEKNKKTNNMLINFNTDLNDYEINLELNTIKILRKNTFYIDILLILFFGIVLYYFMDLIFNSNETFINGHKPFRIIFFIVFCVYISNIYFKKFKTIFLINKAVKKYFK